MITQQPARVHRVQQLPRQQGKSAAIQAHTSIAKMYKALHTKANLVRGNYDISLAQRAKYSRNMYADVVRIAATKELPWRVRVKGEQINRLIPSDELLSKVILGHLWKQDGELMYILSIGENKRNDNPHVVIASMQHVPGADKQEVLADVPRPPEHSPKPWKRPEPLSMPKDMDVGEVPVEYLDEEQFERCYECWVEHSREALFVQETFDDVGAVWNDLLGSAGISLTGKQHAEADSYDNLHLPEPRDPEDWHHDDCVVSEPLWGTARVGDLRCMTGSRLVRYIEANLGGFLYDKDPDWPAYVAIAPFRKFMSAPDNATTIDTLLDESRRALEKVWNEEALHAGSRERFYDDAQANEWTFDKLGYIS